MRVLWLNWRDLANPRAGGAEVFTEEVLRCWASWGHEVTLFTSEVDGLPRHELVEGVEVIRQGNRFTVYRAARRFWAKHRQRFDVVIDEINTRPFGTPLYVRDAPVVALMHQLAADVWRHEVPWPAAVLGERWLEPRWLSYYRETPLMTISASSAKTISAMGPTDINIVPVGMTVPEVGADLAPYGAPTAVFLGRLAANKRPDHAVRAFRIAQEEFADAELLVIGSGPLEKYLAELKVPGVTLMGRLEERHKAEVLARSHVLLATSLREGWGLNVSEAAWLGTPTIGYNVPGLADSVPASGGVLVEPEPHAMANALRAFWRGELSMPPRPSTVSWTEVARHCFRVVEHVARGGRASEIPSYEPH